MFSRFLILYNEVLLPSSHRWTGTPGILSDWPPIRAFTSINCSGVTWYSWNHVPPGNSCVLLVVPRLVFRKTDPDTRCRKAVKDPGLSERIVTSYPSFCHVSRDGSKKSSAPYPSFVRIGTPMAAVGLPSKR